MKLMIIPSVILLSGLASPVFAGCNSGPSFLTQAQINTILSNRYACGQSTANAPGWNELHNGGPGSRIIEQHLAGSTDDEDVGSWNTSVPTGNGRVTYSYTGGNTPVYEVATDAGGNCNAGAGTCTTVPAIFQFCGVGGGAPAVLKILVTATLPSLASCPPN